MLETRDQTFEGFYTGNGEYRIRFVPKETGDFEFVLRSEIPELNGITGVLRAVAEIPENRSTTGGDLTNWWSDDLSPEYAEGAHSGAKTVSRWRVDYLTDFAARFDRCVNVKNT